MRLIGSILTLDQITTVTASSQSNQFPVDNLKHEHRSKQWRSSGFFRIGTSNKIDFAESGATLTATVPAGDYSTTQLQTAITSALHAAGTGTYVTSMSRTTGLWQIQGSASFTLKNMSGAHAQTNLLVSHLGFAASDSSGSLQIGVLPAIHTEESVTFDVRTTEPVNSVVLLWPKEDGIRLSDSAAIRVQASATNVWDSTPVDVALTVNDDFELASHYFTENQNYRYWRVTIVDPQNPFLYVNLGVVILGNSEVVDDPDNGFTYSKNDTSAVTTTAFGNRYTDIQPIFASLALSFGNMDFDAANAFQKLYSQVGITKPVFVTVDADGNVFADDSFAIYGKFNSALTLTHAVYRIFSTALTIDEIG